MCINLCNELIWLQSVAERELSNWIDLSHFYEYHKVTSWITVKWTFCKMFFIFLYFCWLCNILYLLCNLKDNNYTCVSSVWKCTIALKIKKKHIPLYKGIEIKMKIKYTWVKLHFRIGNIGPKTLNGSFTKIFNNFFSWNMFWTFSTLILLYVHLTCLSPWGGSSDRLILQLIDQSKVLIKDVQCQ